MSSLKCKMCVFPGSKERVNTGKEKGFHLFPLSSLTPEEQEAEEEEELLHSWLLKWPPRRILSSALLPGGAGGMPNLLGFPWPPPPPSELLSLNLL